MKMNLSAKGRKLLGAFGLGRSVREERQGTDPDGGSAQCAATISVGFSKSDEIMNKRTNTLWCRGLAMLGLTFALASTTLGQITIQWSDPAAIEYGTPLTATQLNARAVDANGDEVPGEFRYSWDAPIPPVNAGVNEDDPATDGVKIGTRELKLSDILGVDADGNADNGQQIPDWRYLDAGQNQNLVATFHPANLVQVFPAQVQIDVNPKTVTIFPQALERNYGEENYAGFEFGKDPTYPTGEALREPATDDFLLDKQGNRIQRGGADIDISSIDPNGPGGYAFTGEGLFFDGFVRGETYTKLTGQDPNVASANEALVTTFPVLRVRDSNNNPIFRAASVGTTGTVTFDTPPTFKNYNVNIGGSGSLTVKKATIRFEGAELIADNSSAKTFGDALVLNQNNGFKAPDLTIDNDFRLGEQQILNFITISSSGTSATANVGTYTINLTETPPQGFDVSILRTNYDLQLVSGTLQVTPRPIRLKGIPSDPPAGFDPLNTSGFNFKLYGDAAQAPTVLVQNIAPHHRKDNVNEYNDPLTPAGAIANNYLISDIKPEAFSSLPTAAHTATLQSVPGLYSVTVSGGAGQGSNYEITHRDSGQFQVRRAYLVIQVGNASSVIGASQAAAPLSLFGVRTFDQVLNGDGSLNVTATLNNILVPGTPMPATGVVGAFNNNPAGPFPVESRIEFKNVLNVRARNYDVYFNDGTGSRNFLNNGTPVAIDTNGAISTAGTAFNNFLPNVFDSNEDPAGFDANGGVDQQGNLLSHALFVTSSTAIGRYNVDVVRPGVSWNPPSTASFGTDTNNGDLNAVFLNPDTGLPLDDNRNVPVLEPGVDFVVQYTLQADGGNEVVIKADPVPDNGQGNAGAWVVPVANPLQVQRLLPAGKTHKLRVKMKLTNAGVAKVPNGRPVAEFEAPTTTRNLTVFARTITIKPRQTTKDAGKAFLEFGTAIPSNSFGDAYWDATYGNTGNLTVVQRDAEIKYNDVKVDVIDGNGNVVAPGATNTPRGDYTIRLRGLAAQNGNVAFTLQDGVLSVTPIKVQITYENNLPTIVYGQKIPTAGVLDATIDTPGAAAEGRIVYTPDPSLSDVFPDFPNQKITAQWVPNDAATSNFGASDKIDRFLGVSRKPITVAVSPVDKIFGNDTPTPTLVTPIDSLLAAKDVGRVTVNIDIAGQGGDKKAQVGEYPTTPNFIDNGNRLANYAVAIVPSRVKVSKRGVTVTPVSRSMEVGQNATDFVDNWEQDNGVKANAIVTFSGLADFHAIGDDRAKLNTAFPGLELNTDSQSLPPVGTTARIFISNLGTQGNAINGALLNGTNYEFTLNNNSATLSVVEQLANLAWNNATVTYGQPIARSGDAADNATKLNTIKALDATSTTTLAGPIVYTFSAATTIRRPSLQHFAAGDVVPDGIILPAGDHKIKATATPAESETNFAPKTVEQTITVNPRPLTITIEDRTNNYGEIDLFFQAKYGIRNNDGVLNTPDQLVNGDTPASLNRQLVLFSNAEENSGAGEYFIAVGQAAQDPNYAINVVQGSQDLFNGRVTDANGVVLVNVGTNFVPDGQQGTGTAFGFVTSNAGLESNAGKLTVVKSPLTIAAGNLTKDQGQANPPLVAVVPDPTQLKNGDTLATLLATPVRLQTNVGLNTLPGQYDIFAFGGSSPNYDITHIGGTFTVQAPPASIGWTPNPSSIVYGTPLGADQLNAASTVPGNFDYGNLPGFVPGAGVQELTVTFTPDDLQANRVTTATATIEVTPAPLTVTANDVSRAFSAANPEFSVTFNGFVNGDSATVITSPVTFQTDGVNGANAGSYPLTPVGGTAANYALTLVPGTVTITKESATISIGNTEQIADGTPRSVSVTTVPEGVSVAITYNGKTDAPVEAGTYEVRAIANDPNYSGFAIATLSVSGTGAVTIGDLVQTFDGTPKAASVVTTPLGLRTLVTYNGSPNVPVNAGTYEVRAIIDDPVYSGFGIDVLEIQPGQGQVNLDLASLVQPVNGVTGAGFSTVPAGLNVEVFYGDITALPTEIGSYDLRAVINDPNWVGQTTGVFEVGRASQTITTFPFPTFTLSGAPINVGLFATASSELPVTFSVVAGNATVNGNTLVVSQPGDVTVLASQAGDDFWAPASKTFTITATGQGVPTQAPQVSFGGVSDGGLVINVTGAPSATVKILSTAVIGSPLSEVATVTLDASGNGSVTIPTDQAAGYFTASN